MNENSKITRFVFKRLFTGLLSVCFGTGLLIRFVVVIVLAIHYKHDFEFIRQADFFAKGLLLWIIVGFLSVILEFAFSIFSIVTARLKQKGLTQWANRSMGLVIGGIIYNAVHIQIYISSLGLKAGTYWNITLTLQFVNVIAAALLEAAGFFMEDTETETETPETPVSGNVSVNSKGKLILGEKGLEGFTLLTNGNVKIGESIWTQEKLDNNRRAVMSKISRGEGNPQTNLKNLERLMQIDQLLKGVVDYDRIEAATALNGKH